MCNKKESRDGVEKGRRIKKKGEIIIFSFSFFLYILILQLFLGWAADYGPAGVGMTTFECQVAQKPVGSWTFVC